MHTYRIEAAARRVFFKRALVAGACVVLDVRVEELGRFGHGTSQAGAGGEERLDFASLKHLDASLERRDGRQGLLLGVAQYVSRSINKYQCGSKRVDYELQCPRLTHVVVMIMHEPNSKEVREDLPCLLSALRPSFKP